jgi:hypothetical protein
MASTDLIGAYRAALARQLPPDVLEEILDGLEETRADLLRQGLDPDAATAKAILDFGEPDLVVAAFTKNAPGRRHAVRLLATGPVFGLLWGTALITSRAWTWPISRLVEIAYGTTLLAVVALLIGVLTTTQPTKTRRAGYAGIGLILLDLGMLGAVTFAAPALTWMIAPAVAASLIRILAVAPRLPALLAAYPAGAARA